MTDANAPTPTACSPPSSIPTEAGAIELPLRMGVAGRSKSPSDELKTHQRGPRTVLRSKSPDLVLQEIWGTCAAISLSGH